MADISIINKDNTDYNVKDAAGRLALAEVENKGAKNVLNNSEAVSQTVGGVTFTLNADGSITANGTKNDNEWFIFSTGNSLKAGTYVLSDGIPIDKTGCQLIITTGTTLGTAIMATAANARPKTTALSTDYTGLYYAIRIASGTVVNNLTFYPMLCTKAEWDISQAYVPYGKTNAELTAENDSQQSEIDYAINTGVKNLFDVRKATFGDTSKISISVDDTVTSTVTSDGRLWDWANREFEFTLPAGTYIFKYSVVSGTVSSALRLRLMTQTENPFAVLTNTKNSVTFTLTSNTTLGFMGKPYALSFKLQIQNAVITDPTYEPYALPNPTLTPAAVKAVDEGAKNVLPITGSTSAVSGITFTVNANGTITSSGTLASGSSNAVFECSNFQLPAGTYVYTCGGAAQQLVRDSYVQKYNGSSWDALARDYENNTFTLTQTEQIRVRLRVYATGTSGTFKPMICTAADWAVSQKFVPYCPTNRELYEKVDGLGTELVANTNLDNLNIGTYYCGGPTIGATLLNSPTQQPFRLIVSYFQSPTNRMQKIIDFNTSTSEIAIYIRVKTSSGWKSWYKFEGTEVT